MIETGHFFIYGLIIGTTGGIFLRRYVWPEASIIGAATGAISGAAILSICSMVLYGLASDHAQQSLIVTFGFLILPIFGAISYMRFLRNIEK